jgi:hypothetical protein
MNGWRMAEISEWQVMTHSITPVSSLIPHAHVEYLKIIQAQSFLIPSGSSNPPSSCLSVACRLRQNFMRPSLFDSGNIVATIVRIVPIAAQPATRKACQGSQSFMYTRNAEAGASINAVMMDTQCIVAALNK